MEEVRGGQEGDEFQACFRAEEEPVELRQRQLGLLFGVTSNNFNLGFSFCLCLCVLFYVSIFFPETT